MKAIVYHQYGSPDVLRFVDVERPVPGDDEVLVRVHAASVNSWDWDLLRGTPFMTRIGGLRRPRHEILGADVAGRVEAVGSGVSRFRPGDEVFGDLSGSGWGGFAEYTCAREGVLAPKPGGITFEEAAAAPQAGVLALQGLTDKGPIMPGDEVLINGAGGGVGTFAVQIANSLGAIVTGVDREDKLDTVRSIGADHVIDYVAHDFTRDGRRYDRVLDTASNRSIVDSRRALKPGGVYVTVGGSLSSLFQAMLLGPLISMTGGNAMGMLVHKPNARDLAAVGELIATDAVVPVIDRRYPLSEVAEALLQLAGGNDIGKLVVTV